jgi:hypothetical protein
VKFSKGTYLLGQGSQETSLVIDDAKKGQIQINGQSLKVNPDNFTEMVSKINAVLEKKSANHYFYQIVIPRAEAALPALLGAYVAGGIVAGSAVIACEAAHCVNNAMSTIFDPTYLMHVATDLFPHLNDPRLPIGSKSVQVKCAKNNQGRLQFSVKTKRFSGPGLATRDETKSYEITFSGEQPANLVETVKKQHSTKVLESKHFFTSGWSFAKDEKTQSNVDLKGLGEALKNVHAQCLKNPEAMESVNQLGTASAGNTQGKRAEGTR